MLKFWNHFLELASKTALVLKKLRVTICSIKENQQKLQNRKLKK